MKKLIWRLRFTFEIKRLLKVPLRIAWSISGSWLTDMFDGDTSECPLLCASEEFEEWANNADMSLLHE